MASLAWRGGGKTEWAFPLSARKHPAPQKRKMLLAHSMIRMKKRTPFLLFFFCCCSGRHWPITLYLDSVAFRQTSWRAKRYISTLDGEDNPLINPRGQKMWSVGGEKKRFFFSFSCVPNRGKTTRSVSLLRRIFAPAAFPLSMGAHWARVQH